MAENRICKECGGPVEGLLPNQDDFCLACREKMDNNPGTLDVGEAHPAAADAMGWVIQYMKADPQRWMMLMESFASTAIEGNRSAEVALSTIQRLNKGWPVSDRYVLGLAWMIRNIEEMQKAGKK